TDLSHMFYQATSANPDVANWDTSSVTDLSHMFYQATSANPDVANWDTSSVTDLSHMFYQATSANPDVANWDTSSVTDLSHMFYQTSNVNPEVSNWDISSVTDMTNMFNGANLSIHNYDSLLSAWNSQSFNSSISFHAGTTPYCSGETARSDFISSGSWAFSDGGKQCTPATPSVPILTLDNGNTDLDNITADSTPPFNVVCSSNGNTITLYSDNPSANTVIATHTCLTIGTESVVVGTLSEGVHNITYVNTYAGYDSSASSALSITLDMTPPTLTAGSSVTNASEVDFSFTSNEAGSIHYSGECTSTDTTATSGANTVTFTPTNLDSYRCEIEVSDVVGNSASLTASKTQPATSSDFIFSVKTDNTGTSSSTQFTVPTTGAGYDYTIDCNNDGYNDARAVNGNYTCDYQALGLGAGTYSIVIKDHSGSNNGFPRIYFNNTDDTLKIVSISQWGTGKWASMAGAFYGASNLTISATDTPALTNVSDMNYMFAGAILADPDVANWDTSSVTNLSHMFYQATSATPSVANWDTSSVTDLSHMFYQATSATPNVANWDTSSATNLSHMFYQATSANPSVANWDTSSVTDLSHMFYQATSANP
ncbi:MAG: BspA family leucine-rich repeat surface protein, partial [Aestuariibacter sp.]|nr:BspA family leucine-rich repeat surface protein [Aestuariibacter sp.]